MFTLYIEIVSDTKKIFEDFLFANKNEVFGW